MSRRLRGLNELDAGERAQLESAAAEFREVAARLRRRGQMTRVAGYVALTALAAIAFVNSPSAGIVTTIFAIGLGAPLVQRFAAFRMYSPEDERRFKTAYVGKIVELVAEGFTYSPVAELTPDALSALEIFPGRATWIHASDQIAGTRNGIAVSYLELNAGGVLSGGLGGSSEYRGVLLCVDFHKNFHGHTVVVPDAEARRLWTEQETRRGKELVRLEHPAFENAFAVYATDDQQARYILTPKMQELLLGARAVAGRDVRACFLGGSVFLTAMRSRNRFEFRPDAEEEMAPHRVVRDLSEVLSLAERVIATMELETRLWTRV